MKKLLVVVDMQNDFITGALGSQQAIAVLPFVRREIAKRREENWEIAYTRDTHAQDYLSTQEGSRLPVEHCIEVTFGWEIVENLYIDGARLGYGLCAADCDVTIADIANLSDAFYIGGTKQRTGNI